MSNDVQQVSTAVKVRSLASNVILATLFAFFAYAAYLNWSRDGQVQMLILAFQEAIIVGFLIFRRYTIQESHSLWDWAVALLGTAAPMLQRPVLAQLGDSPILTNVGISLQLIGIVIATIGTISLGRSFGIVAANRGVRTVGMYRFMRHPLYGGYIIGYLGFLLGNITLWNVAMVAIAIALQYARSLAEERILLQDPAYQEYYQKVRYRFIPYIF